MKDALIGWTGFIGQELLLHLPDADIYNSRNIGTIIGKEYNYIYFSGLPAEKWKINLDPEKDKQNLLQIIEIIKSVKCNKFILISTIDVLDCSVQQNEDGNIFASHPYGQHRKQMEDFISSFYNSFLIIRLPGLFGIGLKKNIIYDLIFNNNIEKLSLDSEFQYYNIYNLYNNIQTCIENNYNIVNLLSEPISVRKIVYNFFPEYIDKCKGSNIIRYNLLTKYTDLYLNTNELLKQLKLYIDYEKKLLHRPYQIAVSNIAYSDDDWIDIEKMLFRYRISNIEVALTKFADWDTFTDNKIAELNARNCKYISCQSILFNTCIEIFAEPLQFLQHYEKVASICQKLGIRIIVFGSPKQRDIGAYKLDDAIELFRKIGLISEKYQLKFCIEHNASAYRCTWLTTVNEVYTFVKQVNHPNILINFDTGNYSMESTNSTLTNEMIPYIGHIQISSPYLKSYDYIDNDIKNKIQNILSCGYNLCISLEIANTTPSDLSKSILKLYELLEII